VEYFCIFKVHRILLASQPLYQGRIFMHKLVQRPAPNRNTMSCNDFSGIKWGPEDVMINSTCWSKLHLEAWINKVIQICLQLTWKNKRARTDEWENSISLSVLVGCWFLSTSLSNVFKKHYCMLGLGDTCHSDDIKCESLELFLFLSFT